MEKSKSYHNNSSKSDTIDINELNMLPGENHIDYMRRIEYILVDRNKDKYNLLLEFLNKLFDLDNNDKKSYLTAFKLIEDKVLKNKIKSHKVLIREYMTKILKTFNIDSDKILKELESETDEELTINNHNTVIYILKTALNKINYSITFTTNKKSMTRKYSIIKNKSLYL